MGNEVSVKFNEKEAILEVRIGSYDDILKEGRLEGEFLDNLFEGYRAVENSEKKKLQQKLSPWKKTREAIRKDRKKYDLPIKEIHLFPTTISEIKSEYAKEVILKSVALETEYSRIMADRWELFADLAISADLLIDISATSNGLYRFITTGEMKEGIAGFGYLAIIGMGLLILYFVLRVVGEEPCKRRNRYLTHILRTPMTLHRTSPNESKVTFSANSE